MWKLSEKTDKALIYLNTNTNERSTWSKIYTHPELGDFYCIDNIMNLPFQRKYLFDLAQQMERIGIEKQEMLDKMQQIMDLCKEKKQGYELEVYNIASTINTTLKDGWDYEKTAMLVCAMMIIQENEIIDTFNQDEAIKKINLWSKDKHMIGFFLTIANSKCNILTSSLEQSIQASFPNLSQ